MTSRRFSVPIGMRNSNELYLLEFYSRFDHAVTPLVKKRNISLPELIPDRSMVIKRRGILDFCNVHALRSAECDTDHELARGKLEKRFE